MTERMFELDGQDGELSRVTARIGPALVAFCRERLATNPVFAMNELLDYTTKAVIGVAPASPDRVLRALRSKGVVKVDCISRSESLYRVWKA